MADAMSQRSLERNRELQVAGVYERRVMAPIDSVWENVCDWEHLPWLHSQAFESIELVESGDWGWHANVGFPGGTRSEIELVTNRGEGCYVARTRSGAGAPSEIWTTLEPVKAEETDVRVEFCVTRSVEITDSEFEAFGKAYAGLYRGLWDQDELMIHTRIGSIRARSLRDDVGRERAERWSVETGSTDPGGVVSLGAWSELRPRLPLRVEFENHPFRIVELEGKPIAHSTECPHWLGPLGECEVDAGEITCPWHGYRFDLVRGESADGRGLRLRPAPIVEVIPETGLVQLRARAASEE